MFSFLWACVWYLVSGVFSFGGGMLAMLVLQAAGLIYMTYFRGTKIEPYSLAAQGIEEPELPEKQPAEYIFGWVTIRPGSFEEKAATKTASASSTLSRSNTLDVQNESSETNGDKGIASPTVTARYSSMLKSFASVRSTSGSTSTSSSPGFTPPPTPVPGTKREKWYGGLKKDIFYCYYDENMEKVFRSFSLKQYEVYISRGDAEEDAAAGTDLKLDKEKLLDGQLFNKKYAILLKPIKNRRSAGLRNVFEGMDDGVRLPATDGSATAEQREKERLREEEDACMYFFCSSPIKAEDWYLAMLKVSATRTKAVDNKDSVTGPTIDQVFSENDMQRMIDRINSQPDSIPMRWFNAMIGRAYFSWYKTAALEELIIAKIMKKIKKSKLPSMLGEVTIREVTLGNDPPQFSKPMLKQLDPDGTTAAVVDIDFEGELRIVITSTFIWPTALGMTRKPTPLEVSFILRKIKGNLLIKMKPPPSNRFWYGFTSLPEIDFEVVPGVSDMRLNLLNLDIIKVPLANWARKMFAETVVVPNMDDIAFYDTRHLHLRGGVFDESAKHPGAGHVPINADIGGEGLEPIPLADGTKGNEAAASNSDGLRSRKSRNNTSSASLAADALAISQPEPSEKTIARSETMPVGNHSPSGLTSSLSTRKWFATKRSGSPEGTSSDMEIGGRDILPGSSVERTASAPVVGESELVKSQIEITEEGLVPGNAPETQMTSASVQTMTTSTSAADNLASASTGIDGTQTPPRMKASISSSSASTDSSAILGHRSSSSLSQDSGFSSVPAPSSSSFGSGNAASLMGSLRSKAAEKKDIQARVSQAKDVMSKWSANWNARRRGESIDATELADNDAQVNQKLQNVEKKLWETSLTQRAASPVRTSPIEIQKPTGTLQQRLAAAAQQASTSRSIDSAPATSPDHGHANGILASPEGHAVDAPLTRRLSTASDVSSSSAPVMRLSMDEPSRPSIRSQPGSSSGMVIPRIPKRPNSLMSIASPPKVVEEPLKLEQTAPVETSGTPPLRTRSRASSNSAELLKDAVSPIVEEPEPAPKVESPPTSPPKLPPRRASNPPDVVRAMTVTEVTSAVTVSETTTDCPPKAISIRQGMRRTASVRTLPEDGPQEMDVTGKEQAMAMQATSLQSTAENALKHLIALDDEVAAKAE